MPSYDFLRPLERPAVGRASAIGLALLVLLFAVQTWREGLSARRKRSHQLPGRLARAPRRDEPVRDGHSVPLHLSSIFGAGVDSSHAGAFTAPPSCSGFALSIGALAWVLAWVARQEDPEGRTRDAIPIATIVLILLTEIVQNNLLNAQVNFVVLAFCIAAIRSGSNAFVSAGWWGAAIATKILPLGVAPWWLLRKRFVVVIAAVVIAVALAVAPALIAGAPALEWTAAYLRGFIGPVSSGRRASADRLQFRCIGF